MVEEVSFTAFGLFDESLLYATTNTRANKLPSTILLISYSLGTRHPSKRWAFPSHPHREFGLSGIDLTIINEYKSENVIETIVTNFPPMSKIPLIGL